MYELSALAEKKDILEDLNQPKDNYSIEIRDFSNYMKKHGLSLSREGITAYLKHIKMGDYSHNGKTSKYSASAYNKRIFAIKSRLNYLMDRQRPSLSDDQRNSIEKFLKSLKTIRRNTNAINPEKILSKEEIYRLIDASSRRISLLIEFLYKTGTRISEATAIQHADLEECPTHWAVRIRGKGDTERFINAEKPLLQAIKDVYRGKKYLFETENGNAYNRTYISKQISKKSMEILGKKASCHTFRHSFATHTIKGTGSVRAVSKYLGHSSSAITLDLYVHENASFEDISRITQRE